MEESSIPYDDSNDDIPLLSLASRTKKINKFTKSLRRTKQLSEGAMNKGVYNADDTLTSADDSRYLGKRPQPRTKKKKEKSSKLKHFTNS